MRATELFAIFAFVKSLEHIYLAPGSMPSFTGSGVISVPSLPPVLLNLIPYDFFGPHVEVPALPTVITPVDSSVSVATIVNAPTCVVYISQIARPKFSPVPVIPPRPQPVCLNRHLHPKFEAPGPKSPWIIPSPFPPPSQLILPNPPFCVPADEQDTEDAERENYSESIWLSLLLSPAVQAGIWNLCRLLARRLTRRSTSQLEPVDSQRLDPLPWSQPNPDIPRRKKAEYKDRVTQPRVFISTLPSLPAGSNALIIIPQRPAEYNASATLSDPVLLLASNTEMSPTPSVTPIPPETAPPAVDQTEVIASSCALSPVPSCSTESSFDESVVQPRPSRSLTPPTLPTALISPLVSEESQSGLDSSCWAPISESVPVVSSDVLEASSSLPACENTTDASAASLPTPTPTPAKKKRVRTKGPKHLRAPKTELPIAGTATTDLPDSAAQESSSQSTMTTIETLNSFSDSIWAPKAVETIPENDVATTTSPADLSNSEVQESGLQPTATTIETSLPASSLSDSIWAPKSSEVTSEKDITPIIKPSLDEEKVSGLQDSIWAAVPDASSQLACESASEVSGTSLPTPTPTPAKKERVRTEGPKPLRAPQTELPTVQAATSESSSSTTATTSETPSEPSSSLSESIWAPKSTENVVAPPPVMSPPNQDKTSGLQDSVWAITPDVPEVVAPIPVPMPAPVISTTSSNPPVSSSSQLAPENTDEASTSLPTTPPAKKKRVRTRGPKHLRIQLAHETTPPSIAEVPLPTTTVETPSESSSSLSESIWAPKPRQATPENVVAPQLGEEMVSRLQDSIWATTTEVVAPPATLPTPPPSAKKASGLGGSIWADDTLAVTPSSTSAPICEEDLLACEQRNESVSASRWANAPDTPSTPRHFAGRGDANRPRGRRGRPFRA